MELTITPELESLIQRKLKTGKYETPQQVIESAVSRLDEKDIDLGMTAIEFQALIDVGWNEAERGETISGEEARARLAANIEWPVSVHDVRITLSAFADLDGISTYLEEKANERIAAHVERRIFAAFDDLVRLTALGHRRDDVRHPELRFYTVFDYLIVFRREPRVVILRIVHGAQNIPAILADL